MFLRLTQAMRMSSGAAASRVELRGRSLRLSFGRRSERVAQLTRRLATLLNAGVPLVRALETLVKQEEQSGLDAVVADVAAGVRGGGRLSDSLARHPRVFDALYVRMVRAGEAGGIIDEVLLRMATFLEASEAIRRKLRAALVYPVIVLLVASGIVGFLVSFVIPQFEAIFFNMLRGQGLPVLTQVVLEVSDFARHRWWVFPLFLIGGVGVCKGMSRSPAIGRGLDRLKLGLPILGGLYQKIAIARFARMFGTLLASGVPILEALRVSRDVAGNSVVAGALTVVHDRVRDGESLARPLELTGVFPVMVSSMIAVGEETARLPEMLERIADDYDAEVNTSLAGLMSALEPVLILLLAVVVGTIVVALFLPILSIIQNLQ